MIDDAKAERTVKLRHCELDKLRANEREYYIAASGRLLMVYSIGATIGPLLAATLMAVYGPSSFFLFESGVAILYATFVLIQVARRPAISADQQEPFVSLPDVTPVAMALDPRTQAAGEH